MIDFIILIVIIVIVLIISFYLTSSIFLSFLITTVLLLSLFIWLRTICDRVVFLPSNKIADDYTDFIGTEFNIDNIHGMLFPSSNSKRRSTVFIFSHGNGGNITWYSKYVKRLLPYGDVVIYDYPGYGQSLGNPNQNNVLESGLKIYDYVASLNYLKIFCYGFSLGGAVTLNIASQRNPTGIVLQSTFARMSDIAPYIGSIIIPDYFGSIYLSSSIKCPVFAAHCPCDTVVPYWSKRELYQKITTKKAFYRLAVDHNVVPPANYFSRIDEFFHL